MLYLILWCLWLLKRSFLKSDENSHQLHHPQQSTLDHFPCHAKDEWAGSRRVRVWSCDRVLRSRGSRSPAALVHVQSTSLPHCETACYAYRTAVTATVIPHLLSLLSTPRHYLQSALIAPHLCRVLISFVIFRLDWWTHQRTVTTIQYFVYL